MLRCVRAIAVLFLGLLPVMIESHAGSAEVATPAASPVAATGDFAGLVDIGGRSLFLMCSGEGSPTVVFESGGYGTPSRVFSPVMQEVAKFTRVCRYERANNMSGMSDPVSVPRSANDVVADLHSLLTVAGVPGPYVLVGASFGGLLVRLYAHTYPDDIVGMVLIDATHEDQDERFRDEFSPEVMAEVRRLDTEGGDPEGFFTADGLDVVFTLMRETRAASPLHPMPLVVLAAGRIDDLTVDGYPAEYAQMWQERGATELQADLATLVPDAHLVIAEESGHFIHEEQPDLVVQAIQDVVVAVRDPSTWEIMPIASPLVATPTS